MRLLIISGPTGVGKSDLASRVAERLAGEIVCADSRQLYRGMPIGSAQPGLEERARAPHHLYETLEPGEACSAGRYRELALPVIRGIAARGRLPILVGGTGLYVKALTGSWELAPAARPETVARLESDAARRGTEELWRELAGRDPAGSARLHPHDRYRIVRALAVLEDTGRPMSAWRHAATEVRDRDAGVRHVALVRPRSELYARIDRRAALMVAGGMLDEARRLAALGLDPARPPLNAIGFRRLFDVLTGRLGTAEATALMARDTRRYAKRQMTWLRGQHDVTWIEAGTVEAMEKVAEMAAA
mgnify:FL=1